jgi:hypothetical protein
MNDPHAPDGPPCAVGLLAATLALMTCHAAPEPDARVDASTQRCLMARKIVSNLFFLHHHPDLPERLRLVVGRLHARWSALAVEGGGELAQGVTGPGGAAVLH